MATRQRRCPRQWRRASRRDWNRHRRCRCRCQRPCPAGRSGSRPSPARARGQAVRDDRCGPLRGRPRRSVAGPDQRSGLRMPAFRGALRLPPDGSPLSWRRCRSAPLRRDLRPPRRARNPRPNQGTPRPRRTKAGAGGQCWRHVAAIPGEGCSAPPSPSRAGGPDREPLLPCRTGCVCPGDGRQYWRRVPAIRVGGERATPARQPAWPVAWRGCRPGHSPPPSRARGRGPDPKPPGPCRTGRACPGAGRQWSRPVPAIRGAGGRPMPDRPRGWPLAWQQRCGGPRARRDGSRRGGSRLGARPGASQNRRRRRCGP